MIHKKVDTKSFRSKLKDNFDTLSLIVLHSSSFNINIFYYCIFFPLFQSSGGFGRSNVPAGSVRDGSSPGTAMYQLVQVRHGSSPGTVMYQLVQVEMALVQV